MSLTIEPATKTEHNFPSNVYDSIKPLYYTSRFLQIWPYKYLKNKAAPLPLHNKLFALVTMMVLLACVGWSTYGKINYVWEKEFPSPTITDVIFTSPLHCLVLYSIFLSNFKQTGLAITFFENLNHIAERNLFMPKLIYFRLRKGLIKRMLLLYFIATILSIIDIYFTVILAGVCKTIYFICLYLSYYPAITILLQVINKAEILKESYKILNDRLRTISQRSVNDISVVEKKRNLNLGSKPQEIRALCKAHIKLSDLMDTSNEMHGLQTALLFCCIISLMLLFLNYALWTDHIKQITNKEEIKIPLIVHKFASVLIFFCPAVMIANSCSSATEEGFETGAIAHNMLLDITVGTNDSVELLTQEELNLIIQQVGQRKTHFSAGGFFTVDFTIVYGLIGAVTSYFIVLLQFKG